MNKPVHLSFALLASAVAGLAVEPMAAPAVPPATVPAAIAPVPEHSGKKTVVFVIPVRDEINRPILYILRRGLKEADEKADAVVLDMDTPGGALDVTFEIMEALGKFHGETLTYVNKEAMSAGAFISATTGEIWFTPDGVIGAAAPVSAEGKDIDVTMKQKITSYLKARVRAISEGKGHRGEVISAMIDADYELKIGDKVVKAKGELLSLTASEANKTYGEPPQALLGAGTAKDIDALLSKKYGVGNYVIRNFQVTWSEVLAQYLTKLTPILLGLGMLALFIEFKTPGFGVFGIGGIVLLAVVFLSSYVAGLSGHEPLLFFGLGVLLVLLELLFWHSAGFLGVAGVALMMLSLLWSMADLWPNEPITIAWSAGVFVRPLLNLGSGLAIAIVLFMALLRFLPRRWVWDRLVMQSTSGGMAQVAGVAPEAAGGLAALVGRRGVAVTALRPGGQVEVAGKRYEAKVEVGAIDRGATIVVKGSSDFALTVEKGDLS